MTKEEAIAAIEDIGWQKSRPGLERTFKLLEKFGNPQNELKFIHVAGSNGKGSSCAMFDAVIRRAGYRCGLYTSPYIQDFCERIRLNGKNISGEDLGRITEQVMTAADEMIDHPTQFELITAVALIYFAEKKADFVVLETGMGGELDSTNVIPAPELACLTNIGLEHTEFLGDTIEKIAATKGGIIKTGCTCVCYNSDVKAVEVIRKICKEKQVPFRLVEDAIEWPESPEDLTVADQVMEKIEVADSIVCVGKESLIQIFQWQGKTYQLNLLGKYQLHNAALVLTGIEALRERGWQISEEAVRQGLMTVSWPARMEVLWNKPLFILDGGHNPQCVCALRESLHLMVKERPIVFLTGVLADKDYPAMMAEMLPLARGFVCLTPESDRALPAEKLAEYIRQQGMKAIACTKAEEGILSSLEWAEKDAAIVCFGSLYMVGGVRTVFFSTLRQFLRKKCMASRNAIAPDLHQSFSKTAIEHLVSTRAFQNAKSVMLYRAFGGELNVDGLMHHPLSKGKTFCFPICLPENKMIALKPKDDDGWQKGTFGILEPLLEKSTVVDPETIDLILCPCTAFDEAGHRFGMGGGYYDRFLSGLRHPILCGVAFEGQKVDQLPVCDWDVPMDFVVTESQLYFGKNR